MEFYLHADLVVTWSLQGSIFISYIGYKLGFRARPVHKELVTVYGNLHLLFAKLPDGFSILVMAESIEDEAHKK